MLLLTAMQLLHSEQDVRISFERDLRSENDRKWDALRKTNEDYQNGLKEIVQVAPPALSSPLLPPIPTRIRERT